MSFLTLLLVQSVLYLKKITHFVMACFKTVKNISACFLVSRIRENMLCYDSQKKVAFYAQKVREIQHPY